MQTNKQQPKKKKKRNDRDRDDASGKTALSEEETDKRTEQQTVMGGAERGEGCDAAGGGGWRRGGGYKRRCRSGGGRVFLFVLSRRRARLNTSPVEWMSVSVSRLEAGRPSCDSMWLPGASRSRLLPLRAEEAGGEEVQGPGKLRMHGCVSPKAHTESVSPSIRLTQMHKTPAREVFFVVVVFCQLQQSNRAKKKNKKKTSSSSQSAGSLLKETSVAKGEQSVL